MRSKALARSSRAVRERFLRMSQKIRRPREARKTRAPTTPPAMAPVLDLPPLLEAFSFGRACVVAGAAGFGKDVEDDEVGGAGVD